MTIMEQKNDEIKNFAFQNNPNLKKPNVQYPFEEWQIREIKRCSEDIHYFVSNYMMLIHPDMGFINFEPHDYQQEFFDIIQNNDRVISVLPRQGGKCGEKSTNINIRNKKTGEIQSITLEEFYEMCKQNE